MLDLLDSVEQSLAPTHVGIHEFAESSDFCDKALYPGQIVLLKLIFLEEMTGQEEDLLSYWINGGRGGEITLSPNIRERRDFLRENGYRHFREVQLIGGRRSSKGFDIGLAMAYLMYETLKLGDPGTHYGIDKEKNILFSCIAGSESQAKEFQFADLSSTIETCKAFDPYLVNSLETEIRVATPTDLRKVSQGKARGGGNKFQRDVARLRGKALAANAGTIRGSATMVYAQPLDAKILTPNGWITMENLQPGMVITGSDGGIQRVKRILPKGYQDIYQVTFSDGSLTRCTADHLWHLYQTSNSSGHIKTTKAFAEDLTKQRHEGTTYKWKLPGNPVVQFNQVELPLSPYLLGVLLGDGSFASRSGVSISNIDPTVLDAVKRELPEEYELVRNSATHSYRIIKRSRYSGPTHLNVIREAINQLGLGRKSGQTKFIPSIYLHSLPEERLALLQGLIDTDGSIRNDGAVQFANTSMSLVNGVVEIVRSLGGYATIYSNTIPIDNTIRGRLIQGHNVVHTVCISGLHHLKLARGSKLVRQKIRNQNRFRRVVDIRLVERGWTQCIVVSNADGLYITDDFIITHNCMDEVAWMIPGESKASAAQVYGAADPSLDQFGLDGMAFVASSPATKVGLFYEMYEANMRPFDPNAPIAFMNILNMDSDEIAVANGNPRNFCFQFPSWALFERYRYFTTPYKRRERGKMFGKMITVSPDWNPDDTDDLGRPLYSMEDKANIVQQRAKEAANPETFKVERRGRFAEVTDAYLNPAMVDQMYKGVPDGFEALPNGDYVKRYKPLFTNFEHMGVGVATNMHRYKFHIDPSSTTAGFGFAIGHIEYFPDLQTGEATEHVVFDLIKAWHPGSFPGKVIKWEPILDEITTFATIFRPFEITFDQHQSAQPIQDLTERLSSRNIQCRVWEKYATNELNWKRAEFFKTALYQGLVHAPYDEEPTPAAMGSGKVTSKEELKFLQQITTSGKFPRIDKQDMGPVQTKDRADCIFEVVYTLIGNIHFTHMRERLSQAALIGGSPGGYGIGQGPVGGPGPPGISDYYSSREDKQIQQLLGRGRPMPGALRNNPYSRTRGLSR